MYAINHDLQLRIIVESKSSERQSDDWFVSVRYDFVFVYFAPMCFDFSMNVWALTPPQFSVAMNKVFRTFRIIYMVGLLICFFLRRPLAKDVLLLVNLPQFIFVLLVGHAFNLNINVLKAIEIRVFLSFHCPKVEVTTCIKCGCKTVPAVFSSIENFDKEVCQALDSSELNWVSKRRERLSQHYEIMTYKQRTFKTGFS